MIRYCATPAGRVAYSASGAGPALLFESGWITHLRGQLELCPFGSFVERLAERLTVIRFDKPGCGLSDRDGIDLSFDGQVAAALAVADALGAARFRLFGASQGGQLAAAIAARYPERVEALAVISQIAVGRIIFGVGIGGEDRREISACGVDPATRGQRMDECLAIVRRLLTGKPTTFHGRFFDLDETIIAPAPAQQIPILVGGRSDAAIRRAGKLGDGWLGIWNSPRRFAAAAEMAADEAARTARPDPPLRHAMQVWCGQADSKAAARACLAPAMEAFYQLPFERFERYCPYGTADDVAEFLAPYLAAGCTEFNLIPQSPDPGQAIAGTAAVKKLLAPL